jgi:hypothetical protein
MPSPTASRRLATRYPLLNFVKRRYNTVLLALSVILILLAVTLVYLLATQAFKPYFNCQYLIDDALNTKSLNTSLCNGAALNIKQYEVIPQFQVIPNVAGFGPITFGPLSVPLLPAMKPIDGPLEAVRKFLSWSVILVFGVVSLVLAFIVIKIKSFVAVLLSPEGRKTLLTNLSIWLLIFAIFCSLFYLSLAGAGG